VARLSLFDDAEPFDVTLLDAAKPRGVVLFSVGAGGNPERHLPLLTALAEQGFAVAAAHCARLSSPHPTENDLLLRVRRLRLALDVIAHPQSRVVGVGHSIGATVLLALAGGQLWMRSGHRLPLDRDERLRKLVLLAPATRFFQAPGALDDVRTPILAWAGTKDTVTPPSQTEFLRQTLQGRVPMDVRMERGAGHFSFMNVPPPNIEESHADRDALLARLANSVVSFAMA
jgi:alpha-beta hydrolase superfamily lysophospholipase